MGFPAANQRLSSAANTKNPADHWLGSSGICLPSTQAHSGKPLEMYRRLIVEYVVRANFAFAADDAHAVISWSDPATGDPSRNAVAEHQTSNREIWRIGR